MSSSYRLRLAAPLAILVLAIPAQARADLLGFEIRAHISRRQQLRDERLFEQTETTRLRMGAQIMNGLSAERLDELTRKLWVDALVFDPAHLGLLTHRFGADHVMMGTDYPFVPGQLVAAPELVRTAAAAGVITSFDTAAILSSNAGRFLAPR